MTMVIEIPEEFNVMSSSAWQLAQEGLLRWRSKASRTVPSSPTPSGSISRPGGGGGTGSQRMASEIQRPHWARTRRRALGRGPAVGSRRPRRRWPREEAGGQLERLGDVVEALALAVRGKGQRRSKLHA